MSSRRFRARLAVAVATALAGVVLLLLSPNRASASVVFGCGGAGTSSPGSDYSGIAFDLETDLGGLTTTKSVTSDSTGIDWNSDGATDAYVVINASTGWAHYHTDWSGPTYHYRNNAISMMSNYSSIVDVVNDTMGIDYSSYLTTTSSAWPQPYSTAAHNFRQLGLHIKVYDVSTGDDLPAGDIGLGLTLSRSSGADDVFDVTLSTDGSSGSAAPWGEESHTVAFADWEFANTFAIGTEVWDASGAPAANSNFTTDVDVEMVEGTALGIDGEIGFEGAYAESAGTVTQMGHPGSGAVAATIDCATEPHDWIGAGYDDSVNPGLAPDALAGLVKILGDSGSGSLDTRTLFADLDLTHPSSRTDARLSTAMYDVNGDGDLSDPEDGNADVDGDGVYDFPWNRVDVGHDASASATTPALDAVFASEPIDGSRETYAALETADLPEDLSFDYVGEVVGFDSDADGDVLDTEDDADGDGYPDELSTDLDRARLWVCETDWSTETCTTTPSALGDTLLTYRNEVPADDADGNVPAEHDALDAAPAVLTDTMASHFDVSSPDDWIVFDRDVGTDSFSVTADIAGVTHGEFAYTAGGSGDTTDDISVALESTGLGELAADVASVAADGSTLDAWAMLEDVPDKMAVDVDFEDTDADGDAIEVAWDNSDRTDAALAVDTVSTTGTELENHIAGWIGDAATTGNGLAARTDVTATFADDVDVEIDAHTSLSPAMQTEVGITTSTADDRSLGMRTRAKLSAQLDRLLKAYVDQPVMDRVELDTCRTTTYGSTACYPVTDIRATAVKDVGAADEPALYGVMPLPIPDPKADAFEHDPGQDWVPTPEYAHYLSYTDDATDETDSVALEPWSVDVVLHELTSVAYDRDDDLFKRNAVCATASVDAGHIGNGKYDFGIGVFTEGDASDSNYVNSALHFTTPSAPDIGFQAHVHTPSEDSGGRIGDLTSTQESIMYSNPLLEWEARECPTLSSHTVDPAPMGGTSAAAAYKLGYQLRSGTFDEVHAAEAVGSLGIDLPNATAGTGSDVAIFSSASYGAIDAAGMLFEFDPVRVEQPLVKTCRPEGNQDLETCIADPEHSQEYESSAYVEWSSSPAGDQGTLGLEAMLDTDDVLYDIIDWSMPDEPSNRAYSDVRRINGTLERIPNSLELDATLTERPREGLMDVDVGIEDLTGTPMEDIHFSYMDETNPGLLAAPELSTHASNEVPNYEVSLTSLSDVIHMTGTLWMPNQGPTTDVYHVGDCSSFYDPFDSDNYYATDGTAPSTWSPDGARDEEDLRPMRVAADLDLLQGAEEIDIFAHVQRDDFYDHEDYDVMRDPIKLSYDSDLRTTGEVEFLYPGLQMHAQESSALGGIEACVDVDIPVKLDWENADRFSLGVDGQKATVSLDEASVTGGTEVTVQFCEEYYDAAGSLTTGSGIWAHEVLGFWDVLSTEYASFVQQEHMALGLIDGSHPKNTYNDGVYNSISLQDMVNGTATSGGWDATDTDGAGNDRYASFIVDPLLHKNVDDEMRDDGGLINEYKKLWQLADEAYDFVVDIDCGSGSCGTLIKDWYSTNGLGTSPAMSRWARPSISAGTSPSSPGWFYTTPWKCIGETKTSSGTVATLDDGTDLSFEARWGGGGRLEIFAVYEYASGEIRYVEEIVDEDIANVLGGTTMCFKYEIDIDVDGFDSTVDTDDGTIEVEIDRKKGVMGFHWATVWRDHTDEEWYFDYSGNMGEIDSTPIQGLRADSTVIGDTDGDGMLDTQPAPVDVGEELRLIGLDAGDFDRDCKWYTGDGNTTPVSSGATFEHSFVRSGTYRILQVCYEDQEPASDKGDHMSLQTDARALWVEVS